MIVFKSGEAVTKNASTRGLRVKVRRKRCAVASRTPLAALFRNRPGRIGLRDFGACSRDPATRPGCSSARSGATGTGAGAAGRTGREQGRHHRGGGPERSVRHRPAAAERPASALVLLRAALAGLPAHALDPRDRAGRRADGEGGGLQRLGSRRAGGGRHCGRRLGHRAHRQRRPRPPLAAERQLPGARGEEGLVRSFSERARVP